MHTLRQWDRLLYDPFRRSCLAMCGFEEFQQVVEEEVIPFDATLRVPLQRRPVITHQPLSDFIAKRPTLPCLRLG